MACSINISSVVLNPSNGTVTVQGSLSIFNACAGQPKVTVQIVCGIQTYNTTASLQQITPTLYTFTASIITKCACGAPVSVTVTNTCSNYTCQTNFTGTLQCPTSCCPTINTNVLIGDCDKNGNFIATFTATITVPNGCPNVVVEWDYGDNTFSGAQAFSPGTSTFAPPPHTYNINASPPPPYTATLNVISPSGCTSSSQTINAPSTANCDCSKKSKKKLCNILSLIFTYGFGVSLVLFIVASCLTTLAPMLQSVLQGIAVGLAIIATVALIIYYFICKKCVPCGWFWLFLWRIFFCAGMVLLVFSSPTSSCTQCIPPCAIHMVCSYFMTLGWVFTLIALVSLAFWIIQCHPKICDILKEIFTTWTIYVLPIVVFLDQSSVFHNCRWVLFVIGNFHFTFYLLMILIIAAIVAWWTSLGC